MRELTRNLLHNALKHSRAGGLLTLRLVLQPTAAGPWAALTVADSGPGIAQALRPRLMQPFVAGDTGPRQPSSGGSGGSAAGAGLGLAICQEIVLSLRGSLSMDNRLQHGRTIGLDATVRLPLAPASSVQAGHAVPAAAVRATAAHAVVDNPMS